MCLNTLQNLNINAIEVILHWWIIIFVIVGCKQSKMFAKTIAKMVLFELCKGSWHVAIREDMAKVSRLGV